MATLLSFDDYLTNIQSEQKQHSKISYADQSLIGAAITELAEARQASYLLDYSLSAYPFINEKLEIFSGCSKEMLQVRGLDYTRKVWHADDWQTNSLYVFPVMLDFLQREPQSKWGKFDFILNYRVKTTNKENGQKYTTITQKSRYLKFVRENLPYLSTGLIDHSSMPCDSNIMHLRIMYENQEIYQQSFISIDKTVRDLTAAERIALKYRATGYSYAGIASKMNNEPNTVSNHLKSIKDKTNCFSQAEIKMLAVQFGLS